MTFSRDDLYRRPNIAAEGTTPNYLRRPKPPAWANPGIPSTLPTPTPGQTWPAPPQPTPSPNPFPIPAPQVNPPVHEIDPPKDNEFNDPQWNPNLLITLLANIRHQQARSAAAFGSPGNSVLDQNSYSSIPSGLFGRMLAEARDRLESNQSDDAAGASASDDLRRPQPAIDPKMVRMLVRR